MNNAILHCSFSGLSRLAVALLLGAVLSSSLWAQANSRGEEFFMISSVDQQTHQVVLMRPTQLTVAATFGPQTVCLGEKGQKLTPKDLRAGDTVWAIVRASKSGAVSAVRIREGAMTQAEMRQLYLHYSPDVPLKPVTPSPLKPAPENGSAAPQTPSPTIVTPNTAMRGMHRPGRDRRHPHGTSPATS